MSAVSAAIARASAGLDWSYPCLLWLADYLRDETGIDYASDWRRQPWTEATAKRALARLAAGGEGATAVERVLDNAARSLDWHEADAQMQGAVMIGVYDGIEPGGEAIGIPAIFDGADRWVFSNDGKGVTVTGLPPRRMWEIRP